MRYSSFLSFFIATVLSAFLLVANTPAQTNNFKQTNLVSDTAGAAANLDPKLINPWGIAYFPGQPFWIADNNSGYSTTYNQLGVNAGDFLVPAPPGDASPSTPTGIVANLSGAGFLFNGRPALFIFDSEDGTISAWNGTDPVSIVVDRSQAGAVYKGLALVNLGQSGTFLLAADFHSRKIDVYDSSFHESHLIGDLTDPQLPVNFAPFGIHVLNVNGAPEIFVTYAMQDQTMHDPVHQAGAGYVDIFDANGSFVSRLVSQGNLNAPWGVVIPPAGFGPFAGKLLIGEFGNGAIDVYDLASGNFIDQLKDANGAVLANASLWDMVFGGGGPSGDPNTLYITAGLANEQHGLFAAISPTTAATPPGADFSIGVNPNVATITSGQSSSFLVTIGGLSGFNSAVTFSCSGEPASSSCSFSPATITPTSGGSASTTLTVSTKVYTPPRSYYRHGLFPGNSVAPIGFLFAGLLLVSSYYWYSHTGRTYARALRLGYASFVLLALAMFSMSGCGSSSPATGTPPGTSTMMVTATSGTISHSVSVNLTVN